MTELATYHAPAAAAIETYQDVAIHRLGEWARSADAAHQIARTLVQTSFCPDSFRNKPGEATAAILAGVEMGLQPMAALRSFDVIQGQAAPRAITLRAVVQSHGHEIELLESTTTRAKMRGRRKGSSDWQTVTWTIERAQRLGLIGKHNWKNQPEAMLVARATSEIARLVAADAILGVPYSAEEIADGATDEVAAVTTAHAEAGNVRVMSRRSRTDRIAEGDVVDVGLPDEPVNESPLLNTRGALAKRMFASLNEIGISDDERLEFCSAKIGRTITSSKEMTDADAQVVIEACQKLKADDDGPNYDEPDITANDPSLLDGQS